MEENGWKEWKRVVLLKLEENEAANKDVRDQILEIRTKDIPAIREDISALKTKASMWGALFGMLAASIISIVIKAL